MNLDNPNKKLHIKDIQILENCSYSTAQRLFSTIKKTYKIKYVFVKHYLKFYFLE